MRFDDTFESYGANQSIKRTGYSLVGWSTDKAGTNVKYEPGKKDCIFDNKGNLTLYAKWSANQYNYTYVAGSGTGTAYTDTITYDQAFTFLSSSDAKLGFSKTGYSFAGWVDSNGKTWGLDWVGKSWTWTGDNYAKDITFTAQWTPNTYKVTLNNQSATTAGTTAYWYIYETYKNGIYYYSDANCTTKLGTDGATITKPTRTGYTFGGYYTGTNGSGTQYVNANGVTVNNMYSTVAKDTTLYAKWTANKYTVTTNANGGTIPATSGWTVASDGTTATKTMTYDANYGTLPTPTRTGYTFAGWWTAASNGTQITTSTKMQTASNHTLYAHWTANNYTISYNPNGRGGLLSGVSDATYSGNNMNIYYTNANHEYRLVNSSTNDPYATIASTVYLTANTTYVMHAEIYTDSGSLITSGSIQIFYGISKAYTEANSKRFSSNATYNTFTVSTTGTYNIRIDNDCNQTVRIKNFWVYPNFSSSKSVTFDSTYGTMPTLSRTGYTFAGWSKNMFNPASAYDYSATTTRSDGTFTFNTGSTNTSSLAFQIQTWSNSSFLDTIIATSSTGIVSGVLNKTASIAKLRFKYNGNSADAWFYYDISDLPDGKYVIQVNVTTMQMNKIVINNIMIEQNSSNTRSTYVSSSTHVTATSKVDEAMNRTLFAQWSGVSYTLTFSQNGGSGGALSSTSYTTSHNTQTITITEPTRAGWTRTGWTVSGNNGSATASGTTLTIAGDTYGNITVTPVWTGKTYTITWSANGGTGGKVSKTSYTVSASSQTATITAPTRTGWNVSSYSVSGNTGTASVSGTTLTIAANTYGNLTVKANWTPKSWTLSKSTYVTVNRTSSPNQGASTGTLGNGETIYYGDVLSFTSKAGTFSRNGRTYQQHINATIKYYTSVGGTQTSTEYSDKVNGAALRAGLTVYGAVTVTASRNYAYRSVWTGNVSTDWIRNGSATIGSGSFGNAGADFIAYGTSYHASGKVTFGTKSNQDGSNSFTNVASWSGGTVHASWWANWEMSCSSSGVYFKGSDMGAYYGKGYVTQIFAYY